MNTTLRVPASLCGLGQPTIRRSPSGGYAHLGSHEDSSICRPLGRCKLNAPLSRTLCVHASRNPVAAYCLSLRKRVTQVPDSSWPVSQVVDRLPLIEACVFSWKIVVRGEAVYSIQPAQRDNNYAAFTKYRRFRTDNRCVDSSILLSVCQARAHQRRSVWSIRYSTFDRFAHSWRSETRG